MRKRRSQVTAVQIKLNFDKKEKTVCINKGFWDKIRPSKMELKNTGTGENVGENMEICWVGW